MCACVSNRRNARNSFPCVSKCPLIRKRCSKFLQTTYNALFGHATPLLFVLIYFFFHERTSFQLSRYSTFWYTWWRFFLFFPLKISWRNVCIDEIQRWDKCQYEPLLKRWWRVCLYLYRTLKIILCQQIKTFSEDIASRNTNVTYFCYGPSYHIILKWNKWTWHICYLDIMLKQKCRRLCYV